MGEQDWFDQDFYSTLGVDKNADEKEIKKAYRKLAKRWHPDQNSGDPKAEERFKEIGEAFSVLSDKKQRERYDAIRAMASGGPRFAPGSGGSQGGGFEDLFGGMYSGGSPRGGFPAGQTGFGGGGGGAGGFEDILSSLFSGGMGGGAQRGGAPGGFPGGFSGAPQAQKGADLSTSTSLTFKQAYEGETLQFNLDGKSMKVRIPAGVRDGQKIRLRGKGQPGVAGGPAGDLVVKVAVEKSPIFSMDGPNLRVRLPISYPEAALGARVDVPLPDGSTVGVMVPEGTSSGRVLRLRERGILKGAKRSDVLVDLVVETPPNVDAEQRKLLEQLRDAMGAWDPRAGLLGAGQK